MAKINEQSIEISTLWTFGFFSHRPIARIVYVSGARVMVVVMVKVLVLVLVQVLMMCFLL